MTLRLKLWMRIYLGVTFGLILALFAWAAMLSQTAQQLAVSAIGVPVLFVTAGLSDVRYQFGTRGIRVRRWLFWLETPWAEVRSVRLTGKRQVYVRCPRWWRSADIKVGGVSGDFDGVVRMILTRAREHDVPIQANPRTLALVEERVGLRPRIPRARVIANRPKDG